MSAAIAEPIFVSVKPGDAWASLKTACGKRFRVSCIGGGLVDGFGEAMRHPRILVVGGDWQVQLARRIGGEFFNGHIGNRQKNAPAQRGCVMFRRASTFDVVALRRLSALPDWGLGWD